MNAEMARAWIHYAEENLRIARWTLESNMVNPSLQNAQQATEKALKAVWILHGKMVRKTHYIADLVEDLASLGLNAGVSEDKCNLLDSVYLPSKCPAMSALPEGMPDETVARQCVELAERVYQWAAHIVKAA